MDWIELDQDMKKWHEHSRVPQITRNFSTTGGTVELSRISHFKGVNCFDIV
jgi:hypothetical protein